MSGPNTVGIYDTAAAFALRDSISGLVDAQGLAIDTKAGRIYVADLLDAPNAPGVVKVFGMTAGHPLLDTITGLSDPVGIAVDSTHGRLYVSEGGTYNPEYVNPRQDVRVYSTTPGYSLLMTIAVSNPSGLAVSP